MTSHQALGDVFSQLFYEQLTTGQILLREPVPGWFMHCLLSEHKRLVDHSSKAHTSPGLFKIIVHTCNDSTRDTLIRCIYKMEPSTTMISLSYINEAKASVAVRLFRRLLCSKAAIESFAMLADGKPTWDVHVKYAAARMNLDLIEHREPTAEGLALSRSLQEKLDIWNIPVGASVSSYTKQ